MNKSSEGTDPTIPIKFAAEDDRHAAQITLVLQAMGYTPARELVDLLARRQWMAYQMGRNYRLDPTALELLARVLAGDTEEEISQNLQVSAATVQWRMTCLLSKIGVGSAEEIRVRANEWVA